jgi:hypothetical protein
MATGGRLSANTAYIVGDAPGGRFTPYTEVFVPDQSGYLLNAQQAAGVLEGGRSQGGIQIINHFYMNAEGADLDRLFATQQAAVTDAAASIGMSL